MIRIALIAAFGAAGTLARLGVANVVPHRTFPWSTLVVNIAGSFALGVLATWGVTKLSHPVGSAIGIGLLGGFTTYSTFALDASLLGDDGRLPAASLYVLASAVLGIGAAVMGIVLGRALLDT